MSEYYLGIDTSNYKTSIAITDENGRIAFEKSEFLDVEKGSGGLRQETALFKHMNRMPDYVSEAFSIVDKRQIAVVSVSSKPRNIEGSYMPVFLAGINTGKLLASALDVPYLEFSHQEGHIEAGLYGSDFASDTEKTGKFAAFHLSGGTTELLICEKTDAGYTCDIVGGSKDISFGQLVDRIGVKLGFGFPAGGSLDRIALTEKNISAVPKIKTDDGFFNLSGLETYTYRELEKSGNAVVSGVFTEIAGVIFDSANFISEKYGPETVLITGGVASSNFIRRYFDERKGDLNPEIIFAAGKLSGDNAVGISLLGERIRNAAINR